MPNYIAKSLASIVALTHVCVADEPAVPDARLLDTSGFVHVGRLTTLSGQSVTLQTAAMSLTLPFAKILRIDQFPARPVLNSRWLVVLANGDNLYIDARPQGIAIDDTALSGRFPVGEDSASVAVPLETVRGILMHVPESAAQRSQFLKQMESSQEDGDVFVLRAGDRVIGEDPELGPDGFKLSVGAGVTKLKREDVQWIRFNPKLVSFPDTQGPITLVGLTDGSRLTVSGIEWQLADENQAPDAGSIARVKLKTAFGPSITVSAKHIASIQPLGHGPVYLSDLKPIEYTFTPFLSRKWTYQLDRCVTGGPLRVHGTRFDKGIGLHSQCRLTYDLGQRFAGFRSVVDLDDSASEFGSAVCRVELDGRLAWSSGPLTALGPSVTVGQSATSGLLDVSHCQRLTIVVEFGARGDIQDHVDLLDAVLIPKATGGN
ncbi:MAG: NPCBM/NEW2 domain-containing protein [Planctomycetota bacterium]|nr:NPCBM/NEW2 domain-containing protein [Planctomycetota bacterium]